MCMISSALSRKAAWCLLFFALLIPSIARADETPRFQFAMTVDGISETQADPGDIVTLTLRLLRTDDSGDYTMYAMQDEVVYDPAFFQPVEASTLCADGVRMTDFEAVNGDRVCAFSFVSFHGGERWTADTIVAMLQLRVLGESGASALRQQNYLVSHQDGEGRYAAAATDVTVVVSDQCTVRFETNGGSAVSSQTVLRGQPITRPNDPERAGFRLLGWYADQALTQPWDFTSAVTTNLTLYAAWEAVPQVADAPETPKAPETRWLPLLALAAIGAFWLCKRK